jgi:hypothetical protein
MTQNKNPMTDQAIVTDTLNQAAMIVGDYLSGLPRDPIATINKLIAVLDNQELAAAIKRMEKGSGLRVVK